MVAKMYYSPNKSNNYKEIKSTPPDIKDDWNKVSSLEFESNYDLISGGHIVFKSDYRNLFGGQIVKKEKGYNELHKYTVLDYRKYLQRKVNYAPTGFKRTSDIAKNLLKKYAINSNSPINLNIKTTPTKVGLSKLVWENKSLFEIINQLIYLEFINGTLIYSNINYKGTFTYAPLPATMNIPVITQLADGSYSEDYSNIVTSLVVDGKTIKENKDLTSLFGNMNQLLNNSDKVKYYSPDFLENKSTKIVTDKKTILKIISNVNKQCREFKYKNDGSTSMKQIQKNGYGTSRALSDFIFTKLKNIGVKNKVVRYKTPKGTFYSVLVYYNSKYYNFDYRGCDKFFKPTTNSLNKKNVVVDKYD
jgi:hypothetical protein